MTARLRISPAPDGTQWQRIDQELEAFSREQGWPTDLDFAIRLFLEELTLNAVNYGSDDQSTAIELDMTSNDREVRFLLVDNGRPFNPLEDAPAPDTDSAVEDRPIGGLGVYLVQTMADAVDYERVDGQNRLTVVKCRS